MLYANIFFYVLNHNKICLNTTLYYYTKHNIIMSSNTPSNTSSTNLFEKYAERGLSGLANIGNTC